jgi:hypothetical protein
VDGAAPLKESRFDTAKRGQSIHVAPDRNDGKVAPQQVYTARNQTDLCLTRKPETGEERHGRDVIRSDKIMRMQQERWRDSHVST